MRLKEQYRGHKQELEEKISNMAGNLHQSHSALYNAQLWIADLEYELAAEKKRNVVNLRPVLES